LRTSTNHHWFRDQSRKRLSSRNSLLSIRLFWRVKKNSGQKFSNARFQLFFRTKNLLQFIQIGPLKDDFLTKTGLKDARICNNLMLGHIGRIPRASAIVPFSAVIARLDTKACMFVTVTTFNLSSKQGQSIMVQRHLA
jgi:hypothetical protein